VGCLRFIFYQNWTRTLHERTVSFSITIRNLATIWMAAIYIFFFPFQSVGRQSRSPHCLITTAAAAAAAAAATTTTKDLSTGSPLHIHVKPLLGGPSIKPTPSIERTLSQVLKLMSYTFLYKNPYTADTSIKRTQTLK